MRTPTDDFTRSVTSNIPQTWLLFNVRHQLRWIQVRHSEKKRSHMLKKLKCVFFGLQVFGFCLNSVKVSSDWSIIPCWWPDFVGSNMLKFEIHVLQFKVFGSPLNSVKVSSDSVNHCLLVSYLVKVFPNLVKDMSRVRPVTPMKLHVFLSKLHVLLSNIKFWFYSDQLGRMYSFFK